MTIKRIVYFAIIINIAYIVFIMFAILELISFNLGISYLLLISLMFGLYSFYFFTQTINELKEEFKSSLKYCYFCGANVANLTGDNCLECGNKISIEEFS